MRRLEKLFPPGYEYEAELRLAGLLWGAAVGISLVCFACNLYYAVDKLYRAVPYGDTGYGRVLREGARVTAFGELTLWYWALWLPLLLFLIVMPLLHYHYYYRDAKSIYVMRRISRRGAVLVSCVRGPGLGVCLAMGTALLVYALYFGIYCLSVPAECMPRFV